MILTNTMYKNMKEIKRYLYPIDDIISLEIIINNDLTIERREKKGAWEIQEMKKGLGKIIPTTFVGNRILIGFSVDPNRDIQNQLKKLISKKLKQKKMEIIQKKNEYKEIKNILKIKDLTNDSTSH